MEDTAAILCKNYTGQHSERGKIVSLTVPVVCDLVCRYTKKCSVKCFVLAVLGTFAFLFLFQRKQFNSLQKVTEKTEYVYTETTDTQFESQQPIPLLECKDTSASDMPGFSKLPDHIKDFLRYKNCRSFPVLQNAPMKCGGPEQSDKVFLLLVIKSSPRSYTRRETIRKTWGQERTYAGVQIRRVFILGSSSNQNENKKIQQLLSVESEENADILQWDFYDTFFNLTLKHEWLQKTCPHVKFLLNGDDDVFVNSDAMVDYLLGLEGNQGDKHLFVGQLVWNPVVKHDKSSKYCVPEAVAPGNGYPPYCAGGGFLLSGFTAREIYRASQNITLLPIDDIYIGMCLQKESLSPASHFGFRTGGLDLPSSSKNSFDPCYYREFLLIHRLMPYEIVMMWKAIHDPTLKCGISVP
ncbi:N-acetyllactosaminide beta-1,3-N-acetylglucosaminyltransferase 3-like [Protopterus annectens]|uniref:N-acetyllactosaminide beta-1,3-N-acetylglucosaminyltransferase 3-like n=1 Tax=Protopterus annectens TaxID=7888 RepID=UPI001CFB6A47|nr:N-acetyllactosaminide beta-1,3-N-acetylglucosaminyltransferase 3-like [Protopterus annectens]